MGAPDLGRAIEDRLGCALADEESKGSSGELAAGRQIGRPGVGREDPEVERVREAGLEVGVQSG